jgi:hypothetical protein
VSNGPTRRARKKMSEAELHEHMAEVEGHTALLQGAVGYLHRMI